MNPALVMLLRLSWRAKVRRVIRSLRTPCGAIFTLLALAMFSLWLGPSLVLAGFAKAPDPEFLVTLTSVMVLFMAVVALFPSGGLGAVFFTPSEIDFLFSGPFMRRELLSYKLVSTLGGLGLTGLIVSTSFLPSAPWWVAAYVGVFLALLSVQLFGMVVSLVRHLIAEHAYTRARRLVLLGTGLLLAGGLWNVVASFGQADFRDWVQVFRAAAFGYVLAPLDVFGWAIAARNIRELALWGSMILLVNAALLCLLFWLDVRWEEAVLTASQRAYDRLQRMRRSGGVWGLAAPRWTRLRLPMLPWSWGAGPLAWRQLTTVVRHPWTLLTLLGLTLLVTLPGLLLGKSTPVGPFVVLLCSLWFSLWLQCDFRGDLDHLAWLKMLPIGRAAVAAGELGAPVLLTTAVQFLLLGGMAVVADAPWDALLVAALFAVPLNLLLFGLQNLLFLFFPARMAPATAADLQHFGRTMVLWLLELIAVMACGGVASGVGLITSWLAGWSWTAGLVAAWVALALEAVATVPGIAWAYRRFDVSLHTPP